MNRYEHTQFGQVTAIAIGVGAFGTAGLMLAKGFHVVPAIAFVVLAAALRVFLTLTVEVDDDSVRFRFGVRFIGKRFPVAEIESCEVVRNRWYYGWGIRLTPHGWLYNVSGIMAVELRMKNGRRYRIGTDEPERLAAAVREAIAAAEKVSV